MVFPNPVSGPGPVHLTVPLTGVSDVEVDVFTTTFRKVNHLEFRNVQPGQSLPIPLVDRSGEPLADGIYYLRTRTDHGHFVVKLLILR